MGTRRVRVIPSGVGRGVGVVVGVEEAVTVGEAVGDRVVVGEGVEDGVAVIVGVGDGGLSQSDVEVCVGGSVSVGTGVEDGVAVMVSVRDGRLSQSYAVASRVEEIGFKVAAGEDKAVAWSPELTEPRLRPTTRAAIASDPTNRRNVGLAFR